MSLENPYTLIFVGTYLLRTGSILLIVFGMRVLLGLYKYNVRMRAFTDSIDESLNLVGVDDLERLKCLSDIMSPNKIDFEASPNFIPDEILAILKEIKKATD